MDTITTDVLVIGAGAAGIRAALAASEAGTEVVMVAKGELTQSGSTFSTVSGGWGIQALMGEERTDENLEAFCDDIMQVGLGRCDPKLVRILVEESGPRLEGLISYGIRFRKDSRGNYIRAKGCFSDYERAFLTESPENIKESFQSILRQCPVKTITAYVVELITIDGACYGAWALTHTDKLVVRINAKATILATGGGAGIFKDHFVNAEQIGDGYALAYRAGAELNNLEFIQFMLGLKKGGKRLFLPLVDLVTPGILQDQEGRDVLEIYIQDPKARATAVDERQKHHPFSCRDSSYLVDIAVARARREGRKTVWRGKSHAHGQDQYEVVHFSHAFNGGVKIDERGESTVPGLFAAGEMAAGPHGADRIGGCMMTATQVFGKRAGQFAARHAKKLAQRGFPEFETEEEIEWATHMPKDGRPESVFDLALQVRQVMGKYAMVLRWEKGVEKCKKALRDCESQLRQMKSKGTIHPLDYFELRNMILTGKLIVESALMKKQSLGPHFREDSI